MPYTLRSLRLATKRWRLLLVFLLAAGPAAALLVTSGATRTQVLAVALVHLSLLLLALRLIRQQVGAPLQELDGVLMRLAASDFSARADVRRGAPDVQRLAGAVNALGEMLAERDREIAALVEGTPDGIVRVAPDGVVRFANQAAHRLLGLAEPLAGRPLSDAAVPSAVADAWKPLAAALAGGHAVAAREVTLAVGGDRRILLLRAVREGTDGAALMVLEDVTAMRDTEAALRQVQKLESIGQLAGGIAHDFNNLLTGVVGFADLALDEVEEGHPARADLLAMRDAVLRSTGMTRQLLLFARQQVPTTSAVAPNEAVRALERILRPLLGAPVQLQLGLDPTVPAIEADASQLDQVLVNLAVNARDAMPRGGRLTIRTRGVVLDAAEAARLGLPEAGAYATIAVEDTGTGMSPEVQARVFEPFFTTKGPGRGTGLGLATCFGIVRQHGGAIALRSQVGTGTTFTLYFRASAAVAGAPASVPEMPWHRVAPAGSERLLLVEDDAMLRGLLARVLRQRGYDVVEATDGAVGLASATRTDGPPFDLVITDRQMPRLGGVELAEQLARHRPDLPVLFITAQPDAISADVLASPMRRLLPKPFTSVQLLQAARELLDSTVAHRVGMDSPAAA